jgi:hypothetical protein
MYLKPTIQKLTNFGHFWPRTNARATDLEFWHHKHLFLLLFYLYIFLSRAFILSGCGMVGKIGGGNKKQQIYRWAVRHSVGVLTRNSLRYLPK